MGIVQTFKNIFVSDSKADFSSDDNEQIRSFFRDSNKITASNAQKISTVFACVNLKANTLSVMPIRLYKYSKLGKEKYRDTALYNILRRNPNTKLPASLYKKMISQDIDLRGNHYTQIVRNGLGQIVGLYPLIADKMSVAYDTDNKKVYTYDGQTISNKKVLHIYDIPDYQGLKGLSRIEYARQELEFADNSSAHGNKIFKNSTTPSGAFETEQTLGEESYKRLKEDIVDKYTGLENSGTPLLLEGGLSFKPLALKNSDAEWLASRKFNREQVANFFGVNTSMINDATNTAYGNLEQKSKDFYNFAIQPLTNIIEETLYVNLLNDKAYKDAFIKIDYNDIYKADVSTRTNYYKTMFDMGVLSPNEIRSLENMNSYDGGDEHYAQLNLSTVKNLNKGEPSE